MAVTRATPKFADYILYYSSNLPLAVVEAKDNNHSIGAGMQQALGYADMMDIPFVFSSNGDGFLLHDRSGNYEPMERELAIGEFPGPKNSGDGTGHGKGLTIKKRRSSRRIITLTNSGRRPGITR